MSIPAFSGPVLYSHRSCSDNGGSWESWKVWHFATFCSYDAYDEPSFSSQLCLLDPYFFSSHHHHQVFSFSWHFTNFGLFSFFLSVTSGLAPSSPDAVPLITIHQGRITPYLTISSRVALTLHPWAASPPACQPASLPATTTANHHPYRPWP